MIIASIWSHEACAVSISWQNWIINCFFFSSSKLSCWSRLDPRHYEFHRDYIYNLYEEHSADIIHCTTVCCDIYLHIWWFWGIAKGLKDPVWVKSYKQNKKSHCYFLSFYSTLTWQCFHHKYVCSLSFFFSFCSD